MWFSILYEGLYLNFKGFSFSWQCLQLHIKIQQDLQGLMDGMKSMLGQQNKQGSSGLPGLGGEASLPKLPKFNFRMPSLPQAPGKPPVNINTVKSD